MASLSYPQFAVAASSAAAAKIGYPDTILDDAPEPLDADWHQEEYLNHEHIVSVIRSIKGLGNPGGVPVSEAAEDRDTLSGRIRWLFRRLSGDSSLPWAASDTQRLRHNFVRVSLFCLLGKRQPKRGQVDTVCRIIFDQGDTILIAKTGFGKSIVFQALAVITGKITLQIVPLTALARAHCEQVASLPGVSPVLLDKDSRTRDPGIFRRVRDGEFTHILLSPEIAVGDQMRKALRLGLSTKIGCVAIDELHIVHQWKQFRKEFTMLNHLRPLLHSSTPFFGCTATLCKEAEQFVVHYGGFRCLGRDSDSTHCTRVIRTSVDRPEIQLCVWPLVQGHMSNFRRLEFLLKSADPNDLMASVSKAIVYIDDVNALGEARGTLQEFLQTRGCSCRAAAAALGVYHGNTDEVDKAALTQEFSSPKSTVRVVLATVALGMGIDIPDVATVVQWGVPISRDLADWFQREGRAVRNGQPGRAIWFAPWYLFDDFAALSPDVVDKVSADPRNTQAKKGLARRRLYVPSASTGEGIEVACDDPRLPLAEDDTFFDLTSSEDLVDSQAAALGAAADNDDDDSVVSMESDMGTMNPGNPRAGRKAQFCETVDYNIRQYTHEAQKPMDEQAYRCRLAYPQPILDFFNARCLRIQKLEFMQEDMSIWARSPDFDCCNRCTPDIFRLTLNPPKKAITRKPAASTKAGKWLARIDEWCENMANTQLPPCRRICVVPASWYISDELRISLARAIAAGMDRWARFDVPPFRAAEDLLTSVPGLENWADRDRGSQAFVNEYLGWLPAIQKAYDEDPVLIERRRKRAAKKAEDAARRAANSRQPGQGVQPSVQASNKRRRPASTTPPSRSPELQLHRHLHLQPAPSQPYYSQYHPPASPHSPSFISTNNVQWRPSSPYMGTSRSDIPSQVGQYRNSFGSRQLYPAQPLLPALSSLVPESSLGRTASISDQDIASNSPRWSGQPGLFSPRPYTPPAPRTPSLFGDTQRSLPPLLPTISRSPIEPGIRERLFSGHSSVYRQDWSSFGSNSVVGGRSWAQMGSSAYAGTPATSWVGDSFTQMPDQSPTLYRRRN